MKKIDCFKFFNELELLHLRFLEYYDYVDYFVLVESTKSHTGKQKSLIFQDNKEKFSKYLDKVIHIVVDDLPDYSRDNIWIPENFQRNCIQRGLDGYANHGDKIFISDCDEFWDKNIAEKYINNDRVSFLQELYYYYVNCKQKQLWNGSIMFTYQEQNPSIQYFRDVGRSGTYCTREVSGWHYSFMGGSERIIEKVENIAESHYIIDLIGTKEQIDNKISVAKDLWDREDDYAKKEFIELTYKPNSLDEFISLYPNFRKVV